VTGEPSIVRGNDALRKLLFRLLHTVLQLALIIRGVELALGGGDKPIGSNLPTLEAADANPMPAPSWPRYWCRSASSGTQHNPPQHACRS
jgi:hypothetical protein